MQWLYVVSAHVEGEPNGAVFAFCDNSFIPADDALVVFGVYIPQNDTVLSASVVQNEAELPCPALFY